MTGFAQMQKGETMNDMISRQAAIDAFYIQADDDGWWTGMVQDMEELLKGLPSVQPRWIPVTERLPDEDMETGAGIQYSADVLITVYNSMDDETIIDYGHTIDGEWISDTTDCHIPNWWTVTAWMPLPEAYKGGQDE